MYTDPPLVAELPVGFQRFHRRRFFNYQLNRAHALGYAHTQDLLDAAGTIKRRSDCVEVFNRLSNTAMSEGRFRNATSYLRIAEFFTPPRSPSKLPTYERYRELFDQGFGGAGIVRHEVPYRNASLPAYLYPSTAGRSDGTVLVHGGFDSLIEEFFAIWQRIAAAGFNVIAFDGPGQGGARALGGLTFDHDWERPVGAVLDHFGVASAALVGISMGGYWALRAAAFEPRIDRVVSWPPVYDWLLRAPAPVLAAARAMLRRRRF
ncbi:MAG: alpha/beta fold hydrolase, partial [Actinomycetota bacterium]